MQHLILTDVLIGSLFGMIKCDVRVPEELRARFAEYRRKVQSNVEKAHVAIRYETSDDAVHRCASGLCSLEQRHLPSQHRHGSVICGCVESRAGLTALVRACQSFGAQVIFWYRYHL